MRLSRSKSCHWSWGKGPNPRRESMCDHVGVFIWETQHRKTLVEFKVPLCLLLLGIPSAIILWWQQMKDLAECNLISEALQKQRGLSSHG